LALSYSPKKCGSQDLQDGYGVALCNSFFFFNRRFF
jgi:hypothetical protein